ncbi:hypothetical protein [Corallococcus sp. CA054B]|nr:hypothetical protein [Corallococcus sp. CA054B]
MTTNNPKCPKKSPLDWAAMLLPLAYYSAELLQLLLKVLNGPTP